MDEIFVTLRRILLCLSIFSVSISGQNLKVSKCGGEGMDVVVQGPYSGILTVKDSTCQVEVRLADSSPIVFFVPYGEKCGIKVNRWGHAAFNLIMTEQKTGDSSKQTYYEVKEVMLLCTYKINIDYEIKEDNLRGEPSTGLVKLIGQKSASALSREYVPLDTYHSPILSVQ